MTLRQAANFFGASGELAAKMRMGAMRGVLSAALRAKRDIVARVIPQLAGHKPIDRGIYRAGWQVQKLPKGAAIYNAAPTASFIEYGVPAGNVVASNKAHMALAEWVQRKLGGGRGKAVSVGAARGNAQSVNLAKAKYDKAKATWTERAKRSRERGTPEPPKPNPPAAINNKARLKHDFGFAWGVAGAILGAMKKRGIFNRGGGLKVLTNYTANVLPEVMRQEIDREVAKALEK